jgi:uncharacterized membrane protein YedE/YeeE
MAHSIMMALLGGALIGLAASAMMLFVGRIAGISGILGGVLSPARGDVAWRLFFLAGLLVAGVIVVVVAPSAIRAASGRSLGMIAAAGLIVGIGTRMGSGCTSGHGVCGLSRFSPRSLVATLTFIGVGIGTATLVRILL